MHTMYIDVRIEYIYNTEKCDKIYTNQTFSLHMKGFNENCTALSLAVICICQIADV